MNLIAKSISVLAAVAAFAVPAVASAHPEFHGRWGGGGGRGWVGPRYEQRGWVAPRAYDRGWVAPRPVYAPPVYGPRVYVAPRAYGPRWGAPRVYGGSRGYYRR
jgi:hypothetical protein